MGDVCIALMRSEKYISIQPPSIFFDGVVLTASGGCRRAACARRLFRPSLPGHGGLGPGDGLGVAEVTVSQGLHVLVQRVDQGDARGDVQLQDVLVGDAVQIFDQGPQAAQ